MPSAPAGLAALIAGLLDKDPARRPTLNAITAELTALPAAIALGVEDTLPAASSKLIAAGAADTTLGAAAGAVSAKRRSRRPWLVGGLVTVAVAGGVAVLVSRGGQETPAAKAPPPAAASVSAPPALPPPRVPTLGLTAIEAYRDPTSASASRLRSAELWTAARDDFADACKQPGRQTRWCAAAELTGGELAMIEGHLERASAAFRAATAIDPTWAVPHVALANALAADENVEPALQEARVAERLEPMWWEAPATGGRAWAAQRAYPPAIHEYQRALEMAPHNAMLMGELALLYHAAAMDSEADRMSAAAIALDPELVSVRLLRGERALEGHDAKQALAEADRILGVAPDDGAALLLRGDALALLGDAAGAFAAYGRAGDVLAPYNTTTSTARLQVVHEAVTKGRLPPPRRPPTPDATTRSKPGCQKGRSCVLPGLF